MINDKNTRFKNTIVQVVVRDSCKICDRVLDQIKSVSKQFPHIVVQTFNLDHEHAIPDYCQTFITPAIWVNGKLWYLGGFDYNRFCEKLILLDDQSIKKNPINKSIN
ncbi:MAG: hypothetical protein HOG73_02130 [Candidatus Marinimicrobia bacterium]|nr:hypothetical protein [Candidatus Neomarinimicrobiota bacterium]MBT5994495.1 hypothetical protein [Candidatus Neomarinimicrobiota bacterium]